MLLNENKLATEIATSFNMCTNFIAEANIMYPLKVLKVEGKIKNFKLD